MTAGAVIPGLPCPSLPSPGAGPAPALRSLPIHWARLCWKLQQSGGFKAWVCTYLLEHFPHFINHPVPGRIVDSQTLFQLQRVGLLSRNILLRAPTSPAMGHVDKRLCDIYWLC